jgi:hypothetical protein
MTKCVVVSLDERHAVRRQVRVVTGSLGQRPVAGTEQDEPGRDIWQEA